MNYPDIDHTYELTKIGVENKNLMGVGRPLDIAELLDVLPKEINSEGLTMRYDFEWDVYYLDEQEDYKRYFISDESLPNALAKMILKLNKEGLL